jgi:hypothetical protein
MLQFTPPPEDTAAENATLPPSLTVGEAGVIVTVPGALTMKSTRFEAPPPGGGAVTMTGYEPAEPRSEDVREIVSWLELRK